MCIAQQLAQNLMKVTRVARVSATMLLLSRRATAHEAPLPSPQNSPPYFPRCTCTGTTHRFPNACCLVRGAVQDRPVAGSGSGSRRGASSSAVTTENTGNWRRDWCLPAALPMFRASLPRG